MAVRTIKTRVLIISDTHCAPLEQADETSARTRAFQHPLPNADVLIHCGDLTHQGKMHQYHQTVDMLEQIDAPIKLVIAGNHDLSLDRDYVLQHQKWDQLTPEQAECKWREARDFWTAADGRAKMAGITFLDEGVHRIELPNGARLNVYASPYTPEFYDWGFPYERDEDRFSRLENSLSDAKNIATNPIPSYNGTEGDIDILITHGPPYDHLDATDRGDKAGCPHLLRAVMRSRPSIHCFGHIHEGWGSQIVSWSPDADAVTATSQTIAAWKDGAWQAGVATNGVQDVAVDLEEAMRRKAAFLDISQSGEKLRRGEQTVLVNAAIMDVKYKPVNAPWIVEIDLPKV